MGIAKISPRMAKKIKCEDKEVFILPFVHNRNDICELLLSFIKSEHVYEIYEIFCHFYIGNQLGVIEGNYRSSFVVI